MQYFKDISSQKKKKKKKERKKKRKEANVNVFVGFVVSPLEKHQPFPYYTNRFHERHLVYDLVYGGMQLPYQVWTE